MGEKRTQSKKSRGHGQWKEFSRHLTFKDPSVGCFLRHYKKPSEELH